MASGLTPPAKRVKSTLDSFVEDIKASRETEDELKVTLSKDLMDQLLERLNEDHTSHTSADKPQKVSKKSDVEKQVRNFDLAPSRALVLKDDEIARIFSTLVGKRCHGSRDIFPILLAAEELNFEHEDKELAQTKDMEDDWKQACAQFEAWKYLLFQVRAKEAAGYGPLTFFLSKVVQYLQPSVLQYKLQVDSQFLVYDNEKPGANPAANSSIIMIGHEGTRNIIPIIVYVYKPVIPNSIPDVSTKYIAEMLLQAQLLFQEYSIGKIMMCLTDLNNFHYYEIVQLARVYEISIQKKMCFQHSVIAPEGEKVNTDLQLLLRHLHILKRAVRIAVL